MLLTLACYLAAAIAIAVYGEIRWHMGRSAQIHRSHKPCIARGYRQGLMKGEDARDVLLGRLFETAEERDKLREQLAKVGQERDGYVRAVDETHVLMAQMTTHWPPTVDPEDALELRTGHRDHELAAEVSVDQWFADVRPIVGGDHDHEVSP